MGEEGKFMSVHDRITGHGARGPRPRPRARHIVALAVALAALVACGDDDGQGAGSTDVADGSPVFAELQVRYEHAAAGVERTYTVTCTDSAELSGDDADVDADAACAALEDPAVVERLTQGPPQDRVCTEIYGGDDTAAIAGSIGDQPVDTVADRTNGCGIQEWDELLAPILPPAIGVVDPTTTSTTP